MKHKSIGYQRRRRSLIVRGIVIGCGALLAVSVVVYLLVRQDSEEPEVATSSVTSETSFESMPLVETSEAITPVPTATPTPTPTPEPVFIESLEGYAPGDVIEADLIDEEDLGRYFTSSSIVEGDPVYQRISGQSYVENNDIALSELRYLKLLHVNFDGCYQVGEMIVNALVAEQVLDIFEQLFSARYEIYSMYLIDDFWVGNATDSDTNSIEYNNTSCFCYRQATGLSHISLHALGLAIDINPQQNPYVRINSDGSLHYSHENASDYVSNRSSSVPHVITEEDYAYQLFASYGWTWGGSWNNPRDYQHFQLDNGNGNAQ